MVYSDSSPFTHYYRHPLPRMVPKLHLSYDLLSHRVSAINIYLRSRRGKHKYTGTTFFQADGTLHHNVNTPRYPSTFCATGLYPSLSCAASQNELFPTPKSAWEHTHSVVRAVLVKYQTKQLITQQVKPTRSTRIVYVHFRAYIVYDGVCTVDIHHAPLYGKEVSLEQTTGTCCAFSSGAAYERCSRQYWYSQKTKRRKKRTPKTWLDATYPPFRATRLKKLGASTDGKRERKSETVPKALFSPRQIVRSYKQQQ